MKKTSTVYKIVVLPSDEKEYKAVQKALTSRGVLFTSIVDDDESSKSQEELKLEAEFMQLTGLSRFRLHKDENAAVLDGNTTRLDCLKAKVKQLRAEAKKASTTDNK